MCEDGRGRGGIHGFKLSGAEVQLSEGVDDDENVGGLESFAVPEEEPGLGVGKQLKTWAR